MDGKKEEWSREGEEKRDERRWQKMLSNAAKPTTCSLQKHHHVSQRKVNMLSDVAELSSSMYSVVKGAICTTLLTTRCCGVSLYVHHNKLALCKSLVASSLASAESPLSQ